MGGKSEREKEGQVGNRVEPLSITLFGLCKLPFCGPPWMIIFSRVDLVSTTLIFQSCELHFLDPP